MSVAGHGGMRVLIAGCGYVGQALAAYLSAASDATIFCVRRHLGDEASLGRVHWLSADLSATTASLPTKLDRIYFTAAPGGSSEAAYKAVYVEALERVLEHLARTGAAAARLVLTSSTSVYGQQSGEWVDEASPAAPVSPLSQLILRGESLLRAGDTAVRLGGIYGPGRHSLIAAVRDRTMVVNPAHSAYTNRIHRDDAARILAFIGALPQPERIYNAVDCASASRYEVAAWLARKLRVPLNLSHDPEPSSFLRGNKRVLNQRLVEAGYRFVYPTYREGYGALLAGGSPPDAG